MKLFNIVYTPLENMPIEISVKYMLFPGDNMVTDGILEDIKTFPEYQTLHDEGLVKVNEIKGTREAK